MNVGVRGRIIISFGIVIALVMAMFVTFAVMFQRTGENNTAIVYEASRMRESLLRASTEIMNMRRMTGMIHAFAGDAERVDTYADEFYASYDNTLAYLNEFETLVSRSTFLTDERKSEVLGGMSEMDSLLEQYKTLLFEPNVISARIGDVEALGPKSVEFGWLITSVSEKTTELIDETEVLQAEGIERADVTIRAILIIFSVIAVVIAVNAIVVAYRISVSISKPLAVFDEWMHTTTREGNITWTEEEKVHLHEFTRRNDEIGRLFRSYEELINYINEICDVLKQIADGRLDVDVKLRSEYDTLSMVLKKMVDDLNNMFSDITNISSHVAIGAQQIADSSGALSQGAVEQSSTIAQLSTSVSTIAGKTKRNAERAYKAAELTDTIKSNAERGSHQMDEMMVAVNEINDASQSISRVIKAIDDIAFQTNILALNAAVEAARAGQHGKGFAVVAEEVRSLAAKSAEAAKDTGELIENSIEKANIGVRIATETAESLSEIVNGVNESNRFINDIARSSKEQSQGIEEINTGIDQVSRVVETNSSSSEETASASEEISGQAVVLDELISQFRIKDSAGKALPPG